MGWILRRVRLIIRILKQDIWYKCTLLECTLVDLLTQRPFGDFVDLLIYSGGGGGPVTCSTSSNIDPLGDLISWPANRWPGLLAQVWRLYWPANTVVSTGSCKWLLSQSPPWWICSWPWISSFISLLCRLSGGNTATMTWQAGTPWSRGCWRKDRSR